MINNYMYSDAAGTDVTATDTDGYIVFAGGTSNLIQNIKTSDILEVGNFALVAADQVFSETYTIGGTPAEGDIVTITIQSPDSRQNRRDVYKVYVHTGDTIGSICADLTAQINTDDTSATAVNGGTSVIIFSATETLLITGGAQGTTTISLPSAATALALTTSPAFFAAKDSVTLGADASYAALYMKVRKFQDQTYIGGGFAGDIIAVYAPTAEVDAMETAINAAL